LGRGVAPLRAVEAKWGGSPAVLGAVAHEEERLVVPASPKGSIRRRAANGAEPRRRPERPAAIEPLGSEQVVPLSK